MAKDKAKAKAKESKKAKKADVEEDEKPKKKGFPPRKDGKAKKKAKKKPLAVFKAPEDFKPFFAKVTVKVEKDGIIGDLNVIRIKGSPNNENAKTVDLALWDPETLRRFTARYCGLAFIKSAAKRLSGPAMAQFIMRVGVKKDTNGLTVRFKDFKWKAKDDKKAKLLDKKNPIYRALRKPARESGGAFLKVKPFPSAADLKALLKAEAED